MKNLAESLTAQKRIPNLFTPIPQHTQHTWSYSLKILWLLWCYIVTRPVTFHEVLCELCELCELKHLRYDTSTGPDQIPTKFLKPITEYIASPLTHIINSFIQLCDFPDKWKQARITPIPKVDSPQDNNDFRPISILPVLSKIYERLVHNQVVEFFGKSPSPWGQYFWI